MPKSHKTTSEKARELLLFFKNKPNASIKQGLAHLKKKYGSGADLAAVSAMKSAARGKEKNAEPDEQIERLVAELHRFGVTDLHIDINGKVFITRHITQKTSFQVS